MLENIIYGMTLRSLCLRNKRNEFDFVLISKIESVPSLNSCLEISKEKKTKFHHYFNCPKIKKNDFISITLERRERRKQF